MGNGVDFKVMAVGLRAELTAAQSELAIWKTKACESAEREAALREELAEEKRRYVRDVDSADEETSALREIIRDLKDWRECSQSLAAFASILDRAESVIPAPGPLRKALTAAEQRNAAIVGKITKCKECGSSDLFWFAQNNVPNGIQQNRLNTHDVKCVFVLGCNECSETLKLVSADKIAEQMTAAIKPAESGASE